MAILILAAARTALGAFGGGLRPLTSVDLGACVLRAVLERAGLEPGRVGEVLLGNVLQAGSGPNVAGQAAAKSGLPAGVPALTLNQAAGSGLRAVALAAQGLAAGGLALAGGTESMSNSPYLLPGARWGARMGATRLLDSVLLDGLGEAAPEADPVAPAAWATFAEESRRRAAAAAEAFRREIVPVALTDRRGDRVFAVDEASPPGRAAAGADGAAALLLGTEAAGLRPIARILGFAQAGTPSGPAAVPAIRRLLAKTGLPFDRVDRWEVDGPDAGAILATLDGLPELDPARVNVRGDGLALGRPLGAAGARALVTLLHLLQDQQLQVGVAAVDAGTGLALAVERL